MYEYTNIYIACDFVEFQCEELIKVAKKNQALQKELQRRKQKEEREYKQYQKLHEKYGK